MFPGPIDPSSARGAEPPSGGRRLAPGGPPDLHCHRRRQGRSSHDRPSSSLGPPASEIQETTWNRAPAASARYRAAVRKFLETLAESGVVPVPNWASAAASEATGADDLLLAADATARLDAPSDAPAFDLDAARWAARILFRASCLLADRTVDASAVAAALGVRGPEPRAAGVCWSADVFLRHLAELHGLARGLAPDDPLVAEIERHAASWPLSSVGMKLAAPAAAPPDCVAADPCLRRLYVDRVLHRGDTSRLAVPWVTEGVRAALGAHPELAPALAAAVGGTREPSHAG